MSRKPLQYEYCCFHLIQNREVDTEEKRRKVLKFLVTKIKEMHYNKAQDSKIIFYGSVV
jgi:hypothetical protein